MTSAPLHRRLRLALAGLGLLAACTGDIAGGAGAGEMGMARGSGSGTSPAAGGAGAGGGGAPKGTAPGEGTGTPAGTTPTDPPIAPGEMGSTPLHRLSQVELSNTLGDLFGASAAAALGKASDPKIEGFDTNASVLTISPSSVDAFFQVAETVAKGVTLTSLGVCVQGAADRDCARMRIAGIAPRIRRRPSTMADLDGWMALWDTVRMREDADAATRAVLQRLLLTPDFQYHVELGDPTTGKLDDYELAARLAFLAWESTPDQALLDAAANGSLRTPAGVETALARLMADAKGTCAFRRFFEQWTDLAELDGSIKDDKVYPGFASLRGPMANEFRRFVDDLLQRDGTLADLFTSPTTFVNDALGKLYGVPVQGTDYQKVQLDPNVRAGFLTQGAFLALHGKANKSAPILRGVFIRERVLCAPVPPPPPGASNVPSTVAGATTTRQYFQALTAPDGCAACHSQINPIGFALEGFDGQGAARTMDNGAPVDTSGAITAGDRQEPVTGAVDLVKKLAASGTVRQCLATNWFRSRFRRIETDGDAATIGALAKALAANGDKLRTLATALSKQEPLYYAHYRVARTTEKSR